MCSCKVPANLLAIQALNNGKLDLNRDTSQVALVLLYEYQVSYFLQEYYPVYLPLWEFEIIKMGWELSSVGRFIFLAKSKTMTPLNTIVAVTNKA